MDITAARALNPSSPGTPGAWKLWAAVAVGAFAGTEARYGLGILFPEHPGGFPWTTLCINVAGSFVLGLLTTGWLARFPLWARAGIGPGILGAFTTFSAVSLALTRLTGLPAVWLGYLGLSLLLGLGAAGAGLAAGRRAGRR